MSGLLLFTDIHLFSWVQTDMGNFGAKALGFGEAPLAIKDPVVGVEKVIGEATKQSHGGRLRGYDGIVQQ